MNTYKIMMSFYIITYCFYPYDLKGEHNNSLEWKHTNRVNPQTSYTTNSPSLLDAQKSKMKTIRHE